MSEDFSFDPEKTAQGIEQVLADVPEQVHPELRVVADIIEESEGYSVTDPDHPVAKPEFTAAWDRFFEKYDVACESAMQP